MKKKILVLCLCVILATIAMVFGTMAYFTDTAAAGTATVTVGSVQIKWAKDTGEAFFKANESIKLMPGVSQEDTLVVENCGSSDAYIRINIIFPNKNIADLFDVQFGNDPILEEPMKIEGTGGETYGYTYLFRQSIPAKDDNKTDIREDYASIPTKITLKGNLDHDDLTALQNGVQVMYLAEAIQVTGFTATEDKTAAEVAFEHFYSVPSTETTAPTETTATTN